MKFYSYTNKGPRKENDDHYSIELRNGVIYACIADGIGSFKNGGLSSNLSVEFFKNNAENFINNRETFINELNIYLLNFSKNNLSDEKLGTTFTAIYIIDKKLFGVHIGDSRVSLLRRNGIKQITEEHNEIGELIKQGKIKSSDRIYYSRNNLLHALGDESHFKFQLFDFELEKRDRIIISTDGFHEIILKKELRDISITNSSFKEFNRQLIIEIESRILKDNTTYISIEV